MSAFGSGGFGTNNNNNNSTGFGGFGSSGFGANQTQTTTSGSLFGGNTATTGGGFSGFGQQNNTNNSSPFGAANNNRPFGAPATTSSGGLFGNNNTVATSGGFGASSGFGNTSNTGGAFGNNNNNASGSTLSAEPRPMQQSTDQVAGIFGQSKPLFGGGSNTNSGFGASNTANTGGNVFGNTNANTNTTTTGFGASNTSGGFGGFGASNAVGNNNDGTNVTPFSVTTEKEGNTGQVQHYQSITFQQPYQNKSFEELRCEDYAKGRRYGTTNGQAGAFGQSTGFGNFGSTTTNTNTTSGGLFGNNTATNNTGGFGAASSFGANNTSGFGATNNANTSGGLFGKPASGSVFGAQSTSATTGGFGSTAGGTGGLFGNSGTSAFGNNNNATSNTAGGLFGNNQNQSRPSFGGFGSTNTATSGFGATNNTAGGLFGGQNNANTAVSSFGQNNQNQPSSNPFGQTNNNTGGGLFGANKTTGGGLFGSTNNNNTAGSVFGGQNNQQQTSAFGQPANNGGGLFGNQNQNKPAGSLFGSTNNTGGGLFGSQNNQQTGSSLFGGNNNNNAASSMFGNQNRPAGSSLFGSTNNAPNNNTTLSLFGNQQGQQSNPSLSLFGGNNQAQSTNAGSLFGGMNQSQQQNQLHTSLTAAPYGNEQLFASLAAPSPPVGPLATPLSGARPVPKKTPSLLASARLNTPVYSPRGGSLGRTGGYGFSYSNYGTPGSAYTSGSLTPGANSLLRPTGSFSGALTSRLSKSFSTSNLRADSASGESRSLLRPSAFSPDGSSGRYANGSVRKLHIDRSLRTDLFGAEPEPTRSETVRESEAPVLSKRVSFGNVNNQSSSTEPSTSNALVRTEEPEEEESPNLMRAGPKKAQAQTQTQNKQPEMQQVNGAGALSTVPEDTEAVRPSSAPRVSAPSETPEALPNEIGNYWTKPAMKDLRNMTRQQLKNIGHFTVGRVGVGSIEWANVDLTNTPLEEICGTIVQLNPRSATVYQDDQDKPREGTALNVPAKISLENSWPRSHGGRKAVLAKSGKEYDRHIARLKRVGGTEFVEYNADKGVWIFKVKHFTTYGLEDDDDESEFYGDEQMQVDSSGLSDPPETPGQHDATLQSIGTGEVEDTFQFKLDKRSQLSVPGGFASEGVSYDYDDPSADEAMEDEEHVMSGGLGDADMEDPFTASGGPVQAPSPGAYERYHASVNEADMSYREDEPEQDIPGSFVAEPKVPRSILKPRTDLLAFASPEKLAAESWEEQLQRTISPKKRDRQALREMQQSLMRAQGQEDYDSPLKQSMLGQSALGQSYLVQKSAQKSKMNGKKTAAKLGQSQGFRSAMDLMDSMYVPSGTGKKAGAATKGFEYPHPKRARLSSSDNLRPLDAEWHDNLKPKFAPTGTLSYSAPGSAKQISAPLAQALQPVIGEQMDVRFAKFLTADDINPRSLLLQKNFTTIEISSGFPAVRLPDNAISFATFADNVEGHLSNGTHEQAIWSLCSIIYDPLPSGCAKFIKDVPKDQIAQLESHIRMDAFGDLWTKLVQPSVEEGLKRARTAEEKALHYLTQNNIPAACEALIIAKDFKLAMLVSQLPSSEQNRSMIKNQIEVWLERNDWSEMSESVRALYSIVAGDLCVVSGKAGAAENRVTEFNIAEKFGLGWQQSFALRLYYGGHQTIVEAIQAYSADLESGRELVQPTAGRSDQRTVNDPIMELMRLFAGTPDPNALFNPLALSKDDFNSRLSWQLASILNSKGIYPLPNAEYDLLTLAFASELEVADKLVSAAWTLLHLNDRSASIQAITGLLDRNGKKISDPVEGSTDTFESLVNDIQVPAKIVWRAKAQYAEGALGDPSLQTEWLLCAGDVDAAHEVLCTEVGPKAIIEQDYTVLDKILQLFKGRVITEWDQGGQVYVDFLKLVHATRSQRDSKVGQVSMKNLESGLLKRDDDGGVKKSLEERVAGIEMWRVLDEALRESGGKDEEMGGVEQGITGRADGVEMWEKYQRAMGVVA